MGVNEIFSGTLTCESVTGVIGLCSPEHIEKLVSKFE